jgi:hypothetical protein
MSLTKVSSAVLNIDDLYGFRNRIINGDMRIDQRNAGASAAFTITGYGTVDRIRAILTGAPGTYSLQQVSDAPNGFSKSLQLTVTSTDATPTSSRQYGLQQRVEGFNTADFNFGSAAASAVTISFWVKCSVTGTFGGVIQNSASDRSYVFSFSVVAANTWEYKTVTIDGDTTGTWLTDNGSGLFLQFTVGADSAVLTTPNVWSAGNFKGPTGQVNLMATNGATFYITGVQLEKGTVATPFERRPFGMELALCQRYYEKSYNIDVAPGTVSDVGRVIARNVTADTFGFPSVKVDFKVTKRATPTIVRYSTNDGASGNIYLTSPAGNSTSNMVNDISMSGFNFYTVSNITNLGGLASMQWVSEIEL